MKFRPYHFILLWTLLNLFQIYTTELTSDEGYYWFYASRLEWGYYDHPPLLALLIWIGKSLFQGELGVRLFNVLLMSLGIHFLLKMCNKRERGFVYIILLAVPLINYITVITFPDTPLVAFSALALFAYKRFLVSNDLRSGLLLSLSFILMLYAKYHAVLFIVLILISNMRLLKNRYFYMIILLTGIAYLPHIWWQHNHGYPSFLFHLQGRSTPFQFKFLLEYLSQQLFVIGVGVIFVPFITKPADQFEKTLKFIAVGTLLFFCISSLRGFVHLHWTSIALFPIIILAARYYATRKRKILFLTTVIPFIIVLILIRLHLSFNILPVNTLHVDYFHDRRLWAEDIREVADDKPVVFVTGNHGLKEAPLYSFYTDGLGIALFPDESHKSQFQIWNYEDSVQNKDVILIKSEDFEGSKKLNTATGKIIHYKEIDDFTSFNNIKIDCEVEHALISDSQISIPVTLYNHRSIPLQFTADHRIYIQLEDEQKERIWRNQTLTDVSFIDANGAKRLDFTFDTKHIGEGKYTFYLGMNDGITGLSINSTKYKLTYKHPNR